MGDFSNLHPDVEQLRSFSLGTLEDEQESAVLQAHLETCLECRQTLETVAGDTVESLVRATVSEPVDEAPESPLPLDHLRYQILEQLGAGGMGTVYRARHLMMDRLVAVKVVSRRVLDHPAAIERFRREVKAAARLSHPNIVTAFDADQHQATHFLVMEYVPGQSLAQRLKERGKLPVGEACEFARQAALGLAHAHQHGMVHRDIKPANLMVAHSAPGQPATIKILDFGLARLASELSDGSSLTTDGSIMGTPDYIAPEQAEDSRKADIRADIYSLGCTLYHLLVGEPPFPSGTFLQKIQAHQSRSPRPLSEACPEAPRELAAVLNRMLAKNPADRFAHPAEVAAALAPFATAPEAKSLRTTPSATDLAGETVTLERPARVRPKGPMFIACGVLGLVLLLVLGVIIIVRDKDGRIIGRFEFKDAKEVEIQDTGDSNAPKSGAVKPAEPESLKEPAGGEASSPDSDQALSPQALSPQVPSPLDALDPAKIPPEDRYDWQPKELVAVLGEHRIRENSAAISALAIGHQGKLLAIGAYREGVIQIADAETLRPRRVLRGHVGVHEVIESLAFTEDDRRLVSASGDGTVRVWDVETGEELERLEGYVVALAPDARRVVLRSSEEAAELRVWDFDERKELRRLAAPAPTVRSAAFANNGRWLLLAGGELDAESKPIQSCAISVWDLETGELVATLQDPQTKIHRLSVSSDSRWVAGVGLGGNQTFIWDLESKIITNKLIAGQFDVAFSPNGKRLFAARGGSDNLNPEKASSLFDSESWRMIREFPRGQIAAFFPDNRRVAITWDNSVRLWDTESGEELRPTQGHTSAVKSVAFSADGETLLSAGVDDVRLWRLANPGPIWARAHQQAAAGGSARFSTDGRRAIRFHDAGATLIDVASGRLLKEFPWIQGTVNSATAVQNRVATIAAGGESISFWDMSSNQKLSERSYPGAQLCRAQFSHDARRVFCCLAMTGPVVVIDVATGQEVSRYDDIGGFVVFSRDGRTAYGYDASQTIYRADLSVSPPKRVSDFLRWHDGAQILSLSLSNDEKRLASCDSLGRVIVWDVDKGDKTHEWKIEGGVNAVAFAPDSRHIATANVNGTIYILRLNGASTAAGSPAPVKAAPAPLPPIQGGEPLSPTALVQRPAKIEGVRRWTIETIKPRGEVLDIAHHPDGEKIAVAGSDGTISLRDARSGRLLGVLVGHAAPMLAWSPDGKVLASASYNDRSVRLWDTQSQQLLQDFPTKDGPSAISWSSDGRRLAVCTSWGAGSGLSVIDSTTGQILRETALPYLADQLAWSPQGETIAIGFHHDDGKVRLYDTQSLSLLRTLEATGGILPLAWSPDGQRLFCGGPMSRCWNPETGEVLWDYKSESQGFYSIACSPDGETVALGSGASVVLVSGRSGEPIRTLLPPSDVGGGRFYAVSWSPDGKEIVAGMHGRPDIVFWDAASGEVVKTVEGLAANSGGGVFWSQDGKMIASAMDHRAWDLATLAQIADWPNTIRNMRDYSPDGRLRVYSTPEGTRVTEAVSGKELQQLRGPNLNEWTGGQIWTADGGRIALMSPTGTNPYTAVIWDTASGERLEVFEIPFKVPYGMAFSPDGAALATGYNDGRIRIWDAASGELLDTFREHTGTVRGLLWSTDCKTLISSADDGMRDWDVDSGRMVRHRPWRMGWPSPNGQLGADAELGALRIWDLETGQRRLTVVPLPDDRYLAISPDGHYRGSRAVERDIVYVVQFDDGRHETLTPQEFAQRFGWKNDPEKVGIGDSANPTAAGSPAPVKGAPAPLPPIQGGEPLSPAALVQRPAKIEGVRGWTIDTVKARAAYYATSYSPNGRFLAVGGVGGLVRILDASSAQIIRVWFTPGNVYSFAWSPESTKLALATWRPQTASVIDATLSVWDVELGMLLRQREYKAEAIHDLAWTRSGEKLAVSVTYSANNRIELCDAASLDVHQTMPGLWASSLDWSPDNKWLAAGASHKLVRVWEVGSNKSPIDLKAPLADNVLVKWSNDGSRIFALDQKATMICWDFATQEQRWTTPVSTARALAVAPNGKTLAAGGDQGAFLLDADTGEVTQPLPVSQWVSSASWSQDSATVALAGTAGRLELFDGISGQVVKTMEGLPASSHPDVIWSTDGIALGMVGPNGWNDPVRQFYGIGAGQALDRQASARLFHSPDGKLRIEIEPDAATGYVTKVVDNSSENQVHLLESGGPQWTMGITWSGDSKRLGFCSDGAQIWNVESGKLLHRLKVGDEITWSAAFSPDRSLFASGSDNSVRLWDVNSGELLDTFRGHTGEVKSLLWSADGKTLTSSAADGMRDWEVSTGRMVRHRPWLMGWPSPDGQLGADAELGALRIWDLETGQRRLTIVPLPDDRYLAISPDGHYRGSRAVERDIVYVVQFDDGRHETLTPQEFAQRFGWKNDPEKVGIPIGEPAAPSAAAADPDRRAAEWVLSIGGQVFLDDQELAHVGELPSGPIRLTGVGLRANSNVTDEGLGNFQYCKNLAYLDLRGTAVTDTGLAFFKDCKSLTLLNLADTQATDLGLAHFKNCKKLAELELRGTQVTDAGLAHFKDCETLHSLQLSAGKWTDAGLAHFQACKNLKSLWLGGANQVTDAGLAHFKDCKSLTNLWLGGVTQATDAGLAHFKDCKNLQEVVVSGAGVTDAALEYFQGCEHLVRLGLEGTRVTGAGLANFKNCTSLSQLWLDGTQVTDTGLAHIKGCTGLTNLLLHSTRVSDAGLDVLAGLPKLNTLTIQNTRISRQGFEQLKEALPGCVIQWSEPNRMLAEQVLSLGGVVEIATPGQDDVRAVPSADALPVEYFQVRRITLKDVKKPLQDLFNLLGNNFKYPEFDRLESMDLSGSDVHGYTLGEPIAGLKELTLNRCTCYDMCASIARQVELQRLFLDNAASDLSALTNPQLEELSLANAGLSDESLASMARLPKLQRLVLDGNPILGRGLGKLNEQPELVDLSLNCPSIADLLAKNLGELKRLKRLSLVGANLSDAGIKHLAGLTNLESLDLHGTKATAAGVAELQKALPKCRILWEAKGD